MGSDGACAASRRRGKQPVKTGEDGLAVLKYFEDCCLEAYPDPGTGGAPWTVGWGDCGPDVVPGLTITQDEADQRLARRLRTEFEPGVLRTLKRMPLRCQFDAFVCLAYNIGVAGFGGSTLVRMFNAREPGVEDEFLRWNKANGKSMHGLRRRRAAERSLYLGADARLAIAASKRAT